MRVTLSISLAIIFCLCSSSGSLNAQSLPVPYRKGNVWGYSDSTGTIVIKPQYDQAGQFFYGRAWVKKDGLFWYIDSKGRRPIRKKFSQAGDFSHGLSRVVSRNSKDTSTINIYGKPGYGWPGGKDTFAYDLFDVRKIAVGKLSEFNERKEFYGRTGDSVQIFKYEKLRGFRADDGQQVDHALVIIAGQAGVINEQGVFILQPVYDTVYPLEDLYFKVMKKGKWAYFDKKGNKVTDFEFDELGSFWNEAYGVTKVRDFAIVKKDGKFGLIGADGRLRTEVKYDKISSFQDGISLSILNGKPGYINGRGKEFFEE